MPLYENVKLQFIQKYILLFKISYISVCSKIFIYIYMYVYTYIFMNINLQLKIEKQKKTFTRHLRT